MPALPSDLHWLGTAHERHQTDERTLGRHVIVKKLKHKPNWVRTLPLGVSQIGADNLPENQPAPLKTLLDHRPQDLQRKAQVLQALDQNAQQPRGYIPDAPANIPPLADNQARIAELESQLQAMQQELEAQRQLREQSEAERDTARSDAASLHQRVAVAESERIEVSGELERVRSQYQEAQQRIQDQTAQLARHEAKRAAKAIAASPVERVIHQQMVAAGKAPQRSRATTLPGPNASSSSTVANNAAESDESQDRPAAGRVAAPQRHSD
ncbi:hypothetical protein [Cupriavidus sp. H18C1]|uniref:hypothetical protein n=1 Tax=Cupriavidus sp. H18C1 TaxID=3241601 RepID=UPI003BB8B111